jgi:hypothetical protein
VAKGKQEATQYTLNDLVASVEMGELQGKKTAKIKMKNGRTLTTLMEGWKPARSEVESAKEFGSPRPVDSESVGMVPRNLRQEAQSRA